MDKHKEKAIDLPLDFTPEDLAKTYKKGDSCSAVCKKWGISTASPNLRRIRVAVVTMGLGTEEDFSQKWRGFTSQDDAKLIAALQTKKSWRAVVRAMGWEGPSAGTLNKRLQKRASELGFHALAENINGTRSLVVWNEIADKKLRAAVKLCDGWAGVIKEMGGSISGSSYYNIKKRVQELNMDFSHFLGVSHARGGRKETAAKWRKNNLILFPSKKQAPQTGHIKKGLLEYGIKIHRCERCLNTEWMNESIPLELHHINGISWDHRLSNLQMLCPTCHTQTESHAGKNVASARRLRAIFKKNGVLLHELPTSASVCEPIASAAGILVATLQMKIREERRRLKKQASGLGAARAAETG